MAATRKKVVKNSPENQEKLPICPFETRHRFTSTYLRNNNSLRLVSYNLLSNQNVEEEKFSYCLPKFLATKYRKHLVSKELLGYHADIICLQELDQETFMHLYKSALLRNEYHWYFGDKGMACFYKHSRFCILEEMQVVFSEEICRKRNQKSLCDFVQSDENLKNSLEDEKASLHVTVLRFRHTGNVVIVGNIYLNDDPEAELIRIIQISLATTYLHDLVELYKKNRQFQSVQLILCGNFNSQPKSNVYKFLTKSHLKKTEKDLETLSNHVQLNHRFRLISASGTPKYTKYTEEVKACLDYIFVELNKFDVRKVVPLPTENELSAFTGLPNEVYPSDHLAVVVELERKLLSGI